MKLLIDENLSFRITAQLEQAGHDTVQVNAVSLNDTDDPVIFEWALNDDRVVITSDADFGMMLAISGASGPSVVLLRSSDHLTPHQQANLIIGTLEEITAELSAGAVASVSPTRIRVRSLPFSGT